MEALHLDFDLTDPRIKLKKKLAESQLAKFKRKLRVEVPKTFTTWLLSYSNGGTFNIGNAVAIFPPFGKFSINTYNGESRPFGLPTELLPFACSGAEDFWCFYTKRQSSNGEFPIIWVNLGTTEREGYVHCNTSFENFLNVNVLNLLYGDQEPGLTYEEASDPVRIRASESEHNKFYLDLYCKYEPSIKINSSDFYKIATTFSQIQKDLSEKY